MYFCTSSNSQVQTSLIVLFKDYFLNHRHEVKKISKVPSQCFILLHDVLILLNCAKIINTRVFPKVW